MRGNCGAYRPPTTNSGRPSSHASACATALPVDADTTTLITYGSQEGVARGFIPKRHHGQRARYATTLLREGVPILDVVSSVGYFDQAHLTRSLRRFIGETPAKIILGQKQLSFLYKTNSSPEAIVLP